MLPHAVTAPQSLTVGVFENPPIVFQSADGTYSGLAVEMLEHVAQLEDWKIQYRHGSWKEILELLDAAQIDLIVGIGYSDERSRIYDFTEHALVSNWGVVFRDARQDITSLFDLAGRRITLMTDSIHSPEFEGFCRILSEEYHELLDAQGREYLGRVIRNANKMGRLIDDLLNLSRISRSSMTLQAVDLSRMVRQLVDEIKSGYAGQELSVSIQDGVTVQADRRLLRVAMMNLLDNAIKYSGRKEQPRVEFGTEQRDGGPVYFVRDNGAGFDMQYAVKLFTPFQRLHSDSAFEGTGVGLATVARIIGRQQGRVWAEAQAGQGASFYFTLG